MTEHVYGESVKDFAEKERVELHPAMDAWMQGDRFGKVVKLGRKYVHVLMDHSGRKLEVVPQNLRHIFTEEKRQEMFAEITESVTEQDEIEHFVNAKMTVEDFEAMPKPSITCDNSLAAVIESSSGSLRVAPEEKVFSVQGQRISTRSSKPWKRKLAKKLLRELGQ